MKPQTIALLILIVLLLIIIVQNSHSIWLYLLFWRISVPQILLIPILLLIGFVIGFFVGKMPGKGRAERSM